MTPPQTIPVLLPSHVWTAHDGAINVILVQSIKKSKHLPIILSSHSLHVNGLVLRDTELTGQCSPFTGYPSDLESWVESVTSRKHFSEERKCWITGCHGGEN